MFHLLYVKGEMKAKTNQGLFTRGYVGDLTILSVNSLSLFIVYLGTYRESMLYKEPLKFTIICLLFLFRKVFFKHVVIFMSD